MDLDRRKRAQAFGIIDLPPDILRAIFSYMNAQELLMCTIVSKIWRSNLGKYITNLHAISFRIFSHPTLMTSHLDNITEFKYSPMITTQDVRRISVLRNLRKLEIDAKPNDSYFWNNIELPTTLVTLKISSIELQQAKRLIQNLTDLTSLSISRILNDMREDYAFYDDSLGLCPCSLFDSKTIITRDLQRILATLTKLTDLEINFGGLPFLACEFATLTKLTSLQCSGYDIFPCFPIHIQTLTNLKRLALPALADYYKDSQYEDIFRPFKHITSFYVSEFKLNERRLNTEFVQRLKKIERLAITERISTPLSNITHLELFRFNPQQHLTYLAKLTTLRYLRIPLFSKEQSISTLDPLTTLVNLQSFYFYDKLQDSTAQWNMIYEYAKKMTNLMAIRVPSLTTIDDSWNLPYEHQWIDKRPA